MTVPPRDTPGPDETSDPTVSRVTPPSSPGVGSGGHAPSRTAPGRSTRRLPNRFNPGDLLAERYRVVAFLGKGGMGEVYRADDLELEQSVALKLLPARAAADPQIAERVRSEVRLARQISHKNVCRIHDIARLPDEQGGDLFITMEYVDGEDLGTLLKRIGKLPQDKAIDVARQLCAALAAAHDQGVLHRDLKPANVMLDGRGRVKLTDFGIAAIVDEIEDEEASSGTPAYMAPEQYEGQEVSKRSDIYSLGLVLYELLTGHAAWGAKTIDDLRRLRADHERPPSLSSTNIAGLDPALAALIDRCIDKDPAERPTSAFAVAAALPGADPLAAALAAGETPSPELIAASGGRGVLAPKVAAAVVVANLALIALSIFLTRGTTLLTVAPPEAPTAVMRDAALDAIRTLGYDMPGHPDTVGDWAIDLTAFRRFNQAIRAGISHDWVGLGRARQTPLRYWLRLEPNGFTPELPSGEVTPDSPPRTSPGSTYLVLDQQRRLIEFKRQPPKRVETVDTSEPDWSGVFGLAGLELEAFTPIEARRQLGTDATIRRAWTGREPDDGTGLEPVAIDVYAGAFGGKVCEFIVSPAGPTKSGPAVEPATPSEAGASSAAIADSDAGPSAGADNNSAGDDRSSSDAGPTTDQPTGAIAVARMAARWLILGTVTLAAGFVAYRNIRLRRSDTRRAVRLGITVFILFGVAAFLDADVLPSGINILVSPYPIYSVGLGFALLGIVCYIAAEPLARSRWPGSLVSWTRLFSGRFRDPMIGRDLLFGLTTGAVMTTIAAAAQFAAPFVGPDDMPPSHMGVSLILGGPVGVASQSISLVAAGLLNSAAIAIIVLLTMLLFGFLRVKPRWPALLAVGLLLVLQSLATPNVGPADQVGLIVANLIILVLIDRVGLLAAAVAITTTGLLDLLINAAPYDQWWLASAAVPAMLVLGTLVYAYRTATAGRPLFAGPG